MLRARSRLQKQNPKSKIQNPEAPPRAGAAAAARFRRIIPGSEMRRGQILSFTAAEASRNLLRPRADLLLENNSAGDRQKIQNPKSKAGGARADAGSAQIPESKFRGLRGVECGAE